jgi:hypothetical protein
MTAKRFLIVLFAAMLVDLVGLNVPEIVVRAITPASTPNLSIHTPPMSDYNP